MKEVKMYKSNNGTVCQTKTEALMLDKKAELLDFY